MRRGGDRAPTYRHLRSRVSRRCHSRSDSMGTGIRSASKRKPQQAMLRGTRPLARSTPPCATMCLRGHAAAPRSVPSPREWTTDERGLRDTTRALAATPGTPPPARGGAVAACPRRGAARARTGRRATPPPAGADHAAPRARRRRCAGDGAGLQRRHAEGAAADCARREHSIAQAIASVTPPPAYSALVYQAIRPSFVLIQVQGPRRERGDRPGLGSGVVITDRGDILTSLHVVANATTFSSPSRMARSRPPQVIAAQPENDIAVLRPAQPAGA